jgi:hypothetical protein
VNIIAATPSSTSKFTILTISDNLALDCAASADCPTVCISVDSFLSTPVILSSTADILSSVFLNPPSTADPIALIASLNEKEGVWV